MLTEFQTTIFKGGFMGMSGIAGEIRMYAGSKVPDNWAFCDGKQLAKISYPDLFSAIGYIYGGKENNFAVPNLKGGGAISAGNAPGLGTYQLGQYGGEVYHQLSVGELPSHSHEYLKQHEHSVPGHTHNVAAGSKPADSKSPEKTLYAYSSLEVYAKIDSPNAEMAKDMLENSTVEETNDGGTELTTKAGSSQTHDNMQPYICINYVICLKTN
jgi:microcystin-dependent protein